VWFSEGSVILNRSRIKNDDIRIIARLQTASFGNTQLFKNFGFNINYRWSDTYFWQATFGDGNIPSYSVLDAQINYSVPKIKSIFKAGGSNILGEEYFSAIGTGAVGSIFYVSWTVNP